MRFYGLTKIRRHFSVIFLHSLSISLLIYYVATFVILVIVDIVIMSNIVNSSIIFGYLKIVLGHYAKA